MATFWNQSLYYFWLLFLLILLNNTPLTTGSTSCSSSSKHICLTSLLLLLPSYYSFLSLEFSVSLSLELHNRVDSLHMDSGNSGSLQSSSGGDDEYDSRADSSFLTTSGNHPIFNPLSISQPSLNIFDPLANYFDPPISSRSQQNPNPNPLLNLDMGWSKSQSNSTHQINPFFTPQTQPVSFPRQGTENIVAAPQPPPRGGGGGGGVSTSSLANTPAEQVQTHVARNPKKRSRASRRAPTTVLTTDTTNFRAMVQEFTGIPAPPFTSSSPFPRSRLDLFGAPSSIRSNLHISQPPSYLLRPFAQKAQQPFVSSSPSLLHDANILSHPPVFSNNISSTSTGNLDLSSELGLLKRTISTSRSSNNNLLNNMQNQNQIHTFQSFLQSPLPNSSLLSSKTPQESHLEIPAHDSHSHLKMGLLDELGLSHGQVNNAHISGLPSLVSSDNGNGDGYNFSLAAASSSSNFQGGKGTTTTDNVAVSTTRGEGMMESWLCSSD